MNDCFQPPAVVSGGKALPCTRCMVQNRPLWRLLAVSGTTQLVVQARNDDNDCIGSTVGKLSHVLSRIREIFIDTLNKNFTDFLPRPGSRVVRMDPLRFLAGCCTRRLNQV